MIWTLLAAALVATPITFPFAGEATAPNITSDGSGGFVVTWLDRGSVTLNFASWNNGRWFQPREIAKRNVAVNRADFPSIAVSGDDVFVHWSEKNGPGRKIDIA